MLHRPPSPQHTPPHPHYILKKKKSSVGFTDVFKMAVTQVSLEELEHAQNAIGDFGGDNRAGIEGTLHRISAIKSRKGLIIGLTCRVGRAVSGQIDMVYDMLQYEKSILFVGRYVICCPVKHVLQ